MPLDGPPWEAIEKQKEKAIEVAPESPAEFWKSSITGGDSATIFKEGGGEEGTRKIPLSYYNKTSAWASDYPLIYRRVMGFINPYPGGIRPREGDGRSRHYSLEEYVMREFGCRVETLEKLIADGWFIPLLADKEDYPDSVSEEISDLFEGVRGKQTIYDVEPRYVNLVDIALGAAATKNGEISQKYARAEGDDWIDINKTIDAWQNDNHRYDPDEWHEWEAIPEIEFDINGVSHSNLRKYVLERAIKLELADDVIGTFTNDGDRIGNIRRTAKQFVEAQGTGAREDLRGELVSQVYTQWNQLGAPAYYCDFSNTFDIGPAPMKNTWMKQLQSWFKSLYQRITQKIKALQTKIGLTEIETSPTTPETLTIPSVPEISLSEVFCIGPQAVSSSDSTVPDDLIDRANAYDQYYEKLQPDLRDGISKAQINQADSYPELLGQRDTGRSDTYVRQLGTNAADAIIIGDTAQSILQVGSDVSSLLGGLEAVSSVAGPTNTGVVAGIAKSVLKVPEYHAETGEIQKPRSTGREDATYGDVWGFPYGGRDIQLNRLKYVSQESLMEVFSLPSLPSR